MCFLDTEIGGEIRSGLGKYVGNKLKKNSGERVGRLYGKIV